MMNNQSQISLTASELGYLWTGYSINNMSKWFLTVFREQAKDEDIKSIYSLALQSSNEILEERNKILSDDGYPTPIGFSETDIEISSPKLFSDRFLLHYMYCASRLGLEFHTRSLALATRDDVRKYHTNCLHSGIKLNEKVVSTLIDKDLYWRPPTLPKPPLQEYIHKSSYLNGWFGDTRPLNSMELANLYLIIDLLVMMKTLFTSFAQTSDSDEIVELFQKGAKVVEKQYDSLVEVFSQDDLPVPPCYSAELSDSTKRILSDRIMVSHVAGLFGSLLSQYGFSLGTIMKHDLVTLFSKLITKAGAFSEKTTKLLIEKEWLEKVPGVSHGDRSTGS